MHDATIPELDKRQLRNFGILTGSIVAGLFGLFFPWLFNTAWPLWPWMVFAALSLWGLMNPLSLRLVYRIWMRFGLLMARITTPIILGILFFAVISPMAVIRAALRKDSLSRQFDPNTDSYRVRSKKPSVENLKRPF